MYNIHLIDRIHIALADKFRGQAIGNLRNTIELIVAVVEEYVRIKQEEVNAQSKQVQPTSGGQANSQAQVTAGSRGS